MKAIIIAILCILASCVTQAQEMPNLGLDTIQIGALRIDRTATFSDTVTSRFTSSTETALLVNSGTYIRNFAPGQSSTMQIMGATSAQSSLLWKGIQISNPMLGVADISLISLAFFDESHILYMPTQEQMSIGGLVSLETREPLENSIHIDYRYSSMQNHELYAFWAKARKKSSHKISWRGLRAQNRYRVDLDGFTYQMEYSQLNTAQAMYDGYFHAKKWKIQSSIWYTKSFREIPASFGGNANNDRQNDQQLRSQVLAERQYGTFDFSQQIAYLLDEIHFKNDFIDDLGRAHTLLAQSTLRTRISRSLKLESWWENKRISGEHPSYHESASDFLQSSLVNTLKINVNRQQISIGANYLYQNLFKNKNRLLPTIEWKYNGQKHTWHLQLTRAIRFPTLNDIHWAPGGNADLLPEDAWKASLGYGVSFQSLEFRTLGYFRNTKNLIQWVPQASFWGPENVARVSSYGVQLIADYNTSLSRNYRLHISQHYYYTRSINANPLSPFYGKQLIYTPIHKISTSLALSNGRWIWKFSNLLSGRRYSNQENSSSLNPFILLDSEVNYKLKKHKNLDLSTTFAVRNITNTIYQHQAGLYQPQRQIELGLSCQL